MNPKLFIAIENFPLNSQRANTETQQLQRRKLIKYAVQFTANQKINETVASIPQIIGRNQTIKSPNNLQRSRNVRS